MTLPIDGAVYNDIGERVLVVSLPDKATGFEMWWRQGHQTLQRTERDRTGPTVWADGAGQRQIAFGLPGENATLRFHFPVSNGNTAYAALVSKPGLVATVEVDRDKAQITGVVFRNRQAG